MHIFSNTSVLTLPPLPILVMVAMLIYRTDLAFYTNGQSVCLTELKGYQAAVGQPVIQPRRPNSRLDKVRHMFSKIT